MSTLYSAGVVTAYGAAVAAGYTGTYAQFSQWMAKLPGQVATLEGMTVSVTTLNPGESATASYDNLTGILSLGIPKGYDGDTGIIAKAYDPNAEYKVGDYVIYNGDLYRCITAITTPEAWTAAHWATVPMSEDVSEVKNQSNALSDITGYENPGENIVDYGALTAGYLTNAGAEHAPTGNQEYITDYIQLQFGHTYRVEQQIPTKALWIGVCQYDADKNPLHGNSCRVVTEETGKISVTFKGRGRTDVYFRVTYRSYGEPLSIRLYDVTYEDYSINTHEAQVQELARTGIYPFDKQDFMVGIVSSGVTITSNNTITLRNGFSVKAGDIVTAYSPTLYLWVGYYLPGSSSATTLHAFGAVAEPVSYTIPKAATLYIQAQKSDASAISMSDFDIVASLKCANQSFIESATASLQKNPFEGITFWDHLFIDKTSAAKVSQTIIPNQSIANIECSKRLGFKIIEGNTQPTSDGHYIMMHGESGKFGAQVISLDNTDISNVSINSKTLSWIQANVRYVSVYDKYKVCPPTLEEFLTACKINRIMPFIGCPSTDVISIANEIMGKDNYIAYMNQDIGGRAVTGATITHYKGLSTKQDIIDWCNTYGHPYAYSMSNTSSFTDADLLDIVNSLHELGYYITFAASYQNPPEVQRCLRLGFDGAAASFEVDPFESGNLLNLRGDMSYVDFETNGTVNNDGTVTLGLDQYIRPLTDAASQFLAKACLTVTYNGSIKIVMGDKFTSGYGYSSSGATITRQATTYFLEAVPTFTIYGNTGNGTVISQLSFCASKC